MATHIAVAGKGGTGKTTFSALMIRYLVEKRKGDILAVDADPNANLNEALGLKVETVIADILDDTKDPKAIPEGMTKGMFIEYKLSHALVETKDVDLLVMGGPQGPGCYCYPNDLLRKAIETLSQNYDYVVMDNEAGLEHISRGTIPRVEHMFVISDASARGVRSAGRVHDLVKNLNSKVDNIYLVVTKTSEDSLPLLRGEIEQTGLTLIGSVPQDVKVTEFDVQGKPLFTLPADSPAVQSVYSILDHLRL